MITSLRTQGSMGSMGSMENYAPKRQFPENLFIGKYMELWEVWELWELCKNFHTSSFFIILPILPNILKYILPNVSIHLKPYFPYFPIMVYPDHFAKGSFYNYLISVHWTKVALLTQKWAVNVLK